MRCALSKSFRSMSLAAALAFAAPCFAAYVFNTVDYPGAVYTDVRAIDNTGRIAGYASLDGVTNFSFTYSGGVFAPLPASPLSPSALGMNDSGVIVGGTIGTPEQAFIFQSGTYTFFSRPGWTNTEARAINNAGLVTGWSYEYDPVLGYTAASGFLYDPATATYTDIPVPGSTFVIAQGINAANQVVGSALLLPGGERAFLRDPATGTLSFFTVGGMQTRARGINDMGLITGFVTSAGAQQGFVGTSAGYELLSASPSATLTAGEAINNAGQVSGLWSDSAGTTHGFIGTPAAMPTGTTSGGAYVFGVDVVPDVPIFIDPPVAVGYDYAIGRNDPRIAKVQLPIGVGDSFYVLEAGGRKFVVPGGEWFDFRSHGFARGVADFRVSCIEVSAGLDPANAQAFPTGLTFVAAGRFTGTQKPRTRDSHAHDGAKCLAGDGD